MKKPDKEYKVTYKTFYNERLRKCLFHNKLMHPLYVQVTFDRVPIIFKSYYFDLFSKLRYSIQVGQRIYTPDIEEIIKKEKHLIEFIIAKNRQSFSLDLFKREYVFYSRDLPDIMEESFTDYLFIFFNDKGMPALATAIHDGSKFSVPYDLVNDMKNALIKPIYNELIENSFYYGPPYLPLYGFMKEIKRGPMLCLTVLEWQDDKIKEKFLAFIKTCFQKISAHDILSHIDTWIYK